MWFYVLLDRFVIGSLLRFFLLPRLSVIRKFEMDYIKRMDSGTDNQQWYSAWNTFTTLTLVLSVHGIFLL